VTERPDHPIAVDAIVHREPNPGDPERLRVELVAVFESGERISTEGVPGGVFVTSTIVGSLTSSTHRPELAAELEAHVRRSVAGELVPREWRFRRLIEALAAHGIAASPDALEQLPFRVDLRLGGEAA
jgi:hypothetical protein